MLLAGCLRAAVVAPDKFDVLGAGQLEWSVVGVAVLPGLLIRNVVAGSPAEVAIDVCVE